MNIAKEEAIKLIDKLPDQATWDDIMYEFYVRKKIKIQPQGIHQSVLKG